MIDENEHNMESGEDEENEYSSSRLRQLHISLYVSRSFECHFSQ